MFISLSELRNRHEYGEWVQFGELDVTAYMTVSAAYLVTKPHSKKPTKTNIRVVSGYQRAMRMWNEV